MSPSTPDAREIVAALLHQRTGISFRAGGPSMNPTIRDGDVVAVQPAHANAIRRGSVVLYENHGRLVLHRCLYRDRQTHRMFAVGDAAVQGGDWIPAADVLGAAESARRGNRIRRLDTRRARWAGLLRFALRPLRRAAAAVHRRLIQPN